MPGIIRWSSFLVASSDQLSFRYPHLQTSPVDFLNSFNINGLDTGLEISPNHSRRKLVHCGSLTPHTRALQTGEKEFESITKREKDEISESV